MTGKQAVAILRQKALDAEKTGLTEVSLSSLRILLEQMDADASGDPMQAPPALLFTARHGTSLAKYRVRADINFELFKSVITAGQAALKSMFLLNGGAAVAILAFVGHLATLRGGSNEIEIFALPLSFYVAGLALVTIASGLTYLAQSAYASRKHRKAGHVISIFIIVASLLSVAAFVVGSCLTYQALTTFADRSSMEV